MKSKSTYGNGISLKKKRRRKSAPFSIAYGIIYCVLAMAIIAWCFTFAFFFYINPHTMQLQPGKVLYAETVKENVEQIQQHKILEKKKMHNSITKSMKQGIENASAKKFEEKMADKIIDNKVEKPRKKDRPAHLSSKLGPYYTNPDIVSNGCSITITLMEPMLGKKTGEVWTAIESAVFNMHPDVKSNVCLYLQTSVCDVRNDFNKLYTGIYERARPETKKMIDSGNVRVTILDAKKYRVKSCKNFYNPSKAWMNVKYWEEEFIAEDSDLILTLQKDVVICHTLNPNLWRDVPYVGAVWPPRANMHNNPFPPEGMCEFLPSKWNEYIKTDKQFPNDICTFENGKAPFGNGGFTLRSRKWMIKAIKYCPHPDNSGLPPQMIDKADCVWKGKEPAEDVYFSTILNGIGAPMPLGFEAALFSAEMMMPEPILEYYSTPSNGERGEEELEEIAIRRWGEEELDKFRKMREKGQIIPIGFHKPYWYFDLPVLLGEDFLGQCKFLEHIIPFERKVAATYDKKEYRKMDPKKREEVQNFLMKRYPDYQKGRIKKRFLK